MRLTIGLKVFGIAVGLLLLMAAVALLSMRMTHIVDEQLVIIDRNYFPAYVALAQANIRSVEESAFVRRLLLAIAEQTDDGAKVDDLRQRVAGVGDLFGERRTDRRRPPPHQRADRRSARLR
jgi:adenylate cyclase